MRYLLVAVTIGVAIGFAAARPAALWDFYRGIYPEDAGKREALTRCFVEDSRFDRLDPAERDACYRRNQVGLKLASVQPMPGVRTANFIDLWRAAGEGHLPIHDVRYIEQNQRYLHPPATAAR